MQNFPISGIRLPRAFIGALALIKQAAARANTRLDLLDAQVAQAIDGAASPLLQHPHAVAKLASQFFFRAAPDVRMADRVRANGDLRIFADGPQVLNRDRVPAAAGFLHPRELAIPADDTGRNEQRDRDLVAPDYWQDVLEQLARAVIEGEPDGSRGQRTPPVEESDQFADGNEGVAVLGEPPDTAEKELCPGFVEIECRHHPRAECHLSCAAYAAAGNQNRTQHPARQVADEQAEGVHVERTSTRRTGRSRQSPKNSAKPRMWTR